MLGSVVGMRGHWAITMRNLKLLSILKYIGFITFLFLSFHLHAQHRHHGIIYPNKNLIKEFCCTYFPNEGSIQLYSQPNGQPEGKLIRQRNDSRGYEDLYTVMYINKYSDTTKLSIWEDLREIGREKLAIPFVQYEAGFVKVLPGKGGKWISIKELGNLGFKGLSYQEFMTEKSGDVLGFYPEAPLNLRNGPSTSHNKIETLSNLHEVSLTGVHEGTWSQVKVIKLNRDRCEGSDVIEEYELEGWIKVIDEAGKLNIWFYTRGC